MRLSPGRPVFCWFCFWRVFPSILAQISDLSFLSPLLSNTVPIPTRSDTFEKAQGCAGLNRAIMTATCRGAICAIEMLPKCASPGCEDRRALK